MRVNPLKSVLLTAATCGALAGGLLAEDFTWTGVAADLGFPGWPIDCNWHPGPVCVYPGRYPDGTDDTATFPWKTTGAWDCDLIGEEIGDMTIEGNVDFDNPELTTVTLGVASLTIAPTQGDVVITVSGATVLVVD